MYKSRLISRYIHTTDRIIICLFSFVVLYILFKQGPPHKCAVIFVDNSGADFILGIVPFARELIRRGTNVIFCANKEPSLNDITSDELCKVLEECSHTCNIIKKAYESNQIRIYANGQKSPCLDLTNISSGNDRIL